MAKLLQNKVSVIVACYNPDMMKLKKTLCSIFNQQGVDFNIIISDDGSKIEYRKELEDWLKLFNFDKNKIKLNFLKENVGTIKNLLSALKICSNKYVKVISPGDYLYDKNSLKIYLKKAEKNNADIVFSRAQYYSPELKFLNITSPINKVAFKNCLIKTSLLYFHDFILGASIFVKRDLLETILNEVSPFMRLVEDVPLTILSSIYGKKIYGVNKKLIWYEYGLGISTSSVSQICENEISKFFEYMYEIDNHEVQVLKKFLEIENTVSSKCKKWRLFFTTSFKITLSRLFYKLTFNLTKRKKKIFDSKKLAKKIDHITKYTLE